MFDHLTETMLKSYYIAENTVGRFCADKRPLFFAYADLFLLPKPEAERLFSLTQNGEVLGVDSEREYHKYLRMKQYLAMIGHAQKGDPECDELIGLKGSAFTAAKNARLMNDAKEARAVACENLTLAAESGSVLALFALGVLQSEGIVFRKDRKSGLKKLLCAADWNSEEGLFAVLYYDPALRERYAERLKDCLDRLGYGEAYDRVRERYGDFPSGRRREDLILEKAFCQGIVRREAYNKSYARLVYSEILGVRDKETLLLSPNKEMFAEASALPLKLGHGTARLLEAEFEGIRPDHPEESGKVLRALGNADLRTKPQYRPLCFVSDSKFMLEYYAALLSRCFERAHTERIEICDLAEYDLEPTKNNIFVRSCDEDAFNVYLLAFRGEIADRAFDAARNFLQSAKRGKFRLNQPSVALDLSSVFPVCFSDRENAAKLKQFCDVIRIAELTAEEKRILTEQVVREKARAYGVEELTMQDELAEALSAYSMDSIDSALDAAVREHRAESLLLTASAVLPYLGSIDERIRTFGFGGSIYDRRN